LVGGGGVVVLVFWFLFGGAFFGLLGIYCGAGWGVRVFLEGGGFWGVFGFVWGVGEGWWLFLFCFVWVMCWRWGIKLSGFFGLGAVGFVLLGLTFPQKPHYSIDSRNGETSDSISGGGGATKQIP